MCRLPTEQTLRQILAKTINPQPSYSDLKIENLGPSTIFDRPEVDFHNSTPRRLPPPPGTNNAQAHQIST